MVVPRCGDDWFRAVYAQTQSSAVAVEVDGRRAAGFVFQIPRHVVTTFDAVRSGIEFAVVQANGHRMRATVVAVDRANDLAILDTRAVIPGAVPLQGVSDLAVTVGDPVMLLGLSLEDDAPPVGTGTSAGTTTGFRVSASAGRVHTPPGGDIEFDASVHHRNVGGALLACDGRVLGVARRGSDTGDVGLAAPIGHLAHLTESIGAQGRYRHTWDFVFGGHLAWQGGDGIHGVYFGPMLSIGAVYLRRFAMHARITAQWTSDDSGLPLVQRSGNLVSASAIAALRIPFRHTTLLSLGLGIDGTTASQTTQVHNLYVGAASGGCTGSVGTRCPIRESGVSTTIEHPGFVMPMAEIDLHLGFFSLYGSVETDFSRVQGRFAIGVEN